MRRLSLLLLLCASCGGGDDRCDPWTQWGGDPAHSGRSCTAAQSMDRTITKVIIDPFVQMEADDADGDILIHYQSPLIVDDDVYVMSKGGTYTPCDLTMTACDPRIRESQVWIEKGLRWEGESLVEKWSFSSDWKPEPALSFEPMFQPAIAGDFIYVPGLGGSLHKLDRATGTPVGRIQPLGATLDPDTYVAGSIAVDADGNVLYSALKLDHDDPYTKDASGWLIKVAPDDTFTTRVYQELVAGAPAPGDSCRVGFPGNVAPPLPPADDENGAVLGPLVACLSQRPAINSAPAIAADGTIYVVSRAHRSDRAGFITALRPDLSTKWSRSFERILDDGCGVLVPSSWTEQAPFGCRMGARMGVDPATNEPPSARVINDTSSSPVALPDGVLYGAYTSYNGARGHLIKLDTAGNVVATHDFGWDVTPALYHHGGSYSIVIKNNNYARDMDGVPLGPFYLEQLSPGLQTEWRYRLTNTESCVRTPDGNVSCADDHPNGFEWCINAPAVDADGTVYGTGEDGNAYAIAQGGVEKKRLFLDMAVGAAYTPLVLDGKGRIYAMNDGALKVLGK